MSMEILYKAKRTDNGKWIEGGYAEYDGKVFIVVWERYIPDTRDWDTANYYENNPQYNSVLIEVIPETVCQYIGKIDKNGRKIFKGDIVRNDGVNDGIFVIEWSNEYAGWCLEFTKKGHILGGFFGELCQSEDCEIIGSIFDNPDLMEGNGENEH